MPDIRESRKPKPTAKANAATIAANNTEMKTTAKASTASYKCSCGGTYTNKSQSVHFKSEHHKLHTNTTAIPAMSISDALLSGAYSRMELSSTTTPTLSTMLPTHDHDNSATLKSVLVDKLNHPLISLAKLHSTTSEVLQSTCDLITATENNDFCQHNQPGVIFPICPSLHTVFSQPDFLHGQPLDMISSGNLSCNETILLAMLYMTEPSMRACVPLIMSQTQISSCTPFESFKAIIDYARLNHVELFSKASGLLRRIELAVLTTPQQILAFLRDCVPLTVHCHVLVIMIEFGSDRLDFEFIENTTVSTSQICICQITSTSQVQSSSVSSASVSTSVSASVSASASTASSIASVSRMCRLDVVRVAETTQLDYFSGNAQKIVRKLKSCNYILRSTRIYTGTKCHIVQFLVFRSSLFNSCMCCMCYVVICRSVTSFGNWKNS